MAAVQNRFLQPQQPTAVWRKRWGGCWGGLSCFHKQKGGKRIVPAPCISGANSLSYHPNRLQAGGFPNQTSGISSSLLAPPSSPASFSNSSTPSTAQSPSCFVSASSPENPSSTMFVTGPYAHETQLVSPPVFSTFTTEPSTAPLTPPPESAHLTTPSSPDVPYARFLTSSAKIETGVSKSQQDSNFFCPETFAQFYLDQSSFSKSGGRLSISRESDAYTNGGYGYQNRQNKSCKADADELEAYRASFGFSADEIITTSNYVEISHVLEDSFSITPLTSDKSVVEEHMFLTPPGQEEAEIKKRQEDCSSPQLSKGLNQDNSVHSGISASYNALEDEVPHKQLGESFHSNSILCDDDDDVFSNTKASKIGWK